MVADADYLIIAYDKDADFIGEAAALLKNRMVARYVCVLIVDVKDVTSVMNCAYRGDVVGWVTSGGLPMHWEIGGNGLSMPKEMADHPNGWSVELLGEILPACYRHTFI